MEVDWNVVTGEIMTQILKVVVPLFVAMIIKWAVELYHTLKVEQPEWIPVLEYAAQVAVLAAEQIYGDGQGAKKKQYAIQTIERILAEKGFVLDLTIIDDAIEAEVWKWLNHAEDDEKPLAELHEPAESPVEE